MRKILLLILITLSITAYGQIPQYPKGYWGTSLPTGSSPATVIFRVRGTDSLKTPTLSIGGVYYDFPTVTQMVRYINTYTLTASKATNGLTYTDSLRLGGVVTRPTYIRSFGSTNSFSIQNKTGNQKGIVAVSQGNAIVEATDTVTNKIAAIVADPSGSAVMQVIDGSTGHVSALALNPDSTLFISSTNKPITNGGNYPPTNLNDLTDKRYVDKHSPDSATIANTYISKLSNRIIGIDLNNASYLGSNVYVAQTNVNAPPGVTLMYIFQQVWREAPTDFVSQQATELLTGNIWVRQFYSGTPTAWTKLALQVTQQTFDYSEKAASTKFVANALTSKMPYISFLTGMITYGQSNSNGGGVLATYTTAQPYTSKMPRYGVYAVDPGTPQLPLVQLQENATETPISGITQNFIHLFENDTKISWRSDSLGFIGATCGVGGQTIAQLSKGTADYARLTNTVDTLVAYALANNRHFTMPYLFWVHGESGLTDAPGSYGPALSTLISDVNADIVPKTKQSASIPFISPQLSWGIHTYSDYKQVAGVQYAMNKNNPLFYLSCPSYQFIYGTGADTVHLQPASRRHLGGYMARMAEFQTVHKTKLLPLDVESVTANGLLIRVKYNNKTPLAIDTSFISNPGQYGYRLVDTATSTNIPLNGVHLEGTNMVAMTSTAAITNSCVLYYGVITGAVSRAVSGGTMVPSRGNIRDSDPYTDAFDGYHYYNWSLMFKMPVTSVGNSNVYAPNLNNIRPDADFTHASPPTPTSTGKRGDIWYDIVSKDKYEWVANNSVAVYPTGQTVFNEIPSGAINGSNTIFTWANTPISGKLSIFYNGQLLRPTIDYTTSAAVSTLTFAPITGSSIYGNYIK